MPSARFKIAHVLPSTTGIGGTETATVRLAQAVEGDEFTSIAFCLPDAAPARELFESAAIPVFQYQATEPSYRRPSGYLRTSLSLALQLRRSRVDLVHFADVLAAHRSSLAAVMAGIPAITHVRGSFPEKLSLRDRSFLFPLRRFVFVSQESLRTFGHQVSPARATVLYDGINVHPPHPAARREVRTEFSIPSSAKVIGMVARIAPQKDFPTLVRAAALLVQAHPNIRFLMVGQHTGVAAHVEHFGRVQRLIGELGLDAHFIFTDHRSDVERFIAAMDVCVLSTHQEGFGLVIIEAMAQAKPFVGTCVGGIPEIIRQGETGLLVPHGDERALANALASLLDDPALAFRLGRAGQQLVETKFNFANFRTQSRGLYRSLLG